MNCAQNEQNEVRATEGQKIEDEKNKIQQIPKKLKQKKKKRRNSK